MNLRLLSALRRDHGLAAERDGDIYRIRTQGGPWARILLPDDLPVEGEAFAQVAALTVLQHPCDPATSPTVEVVATPDLHPGDGIAVGSVLLTTEDVVVPEAIGSDAGCGMRCVVLDLQCDTVLLYKAEIVRLLTADLLVGGTRDVAMPGEALRAALTGGIPAWKRAVATSTGQGFLFTLDLETLAGAEPVTGAADSVTGLAQRFAHPMVRDQGLGTIGRGNHFVELQRVEQIVDKRAAYTLGVRPESVILTIHSGSREVGRTLAGAWKTWSREAWPQDRKRPGIVPIAGKDCDQYIGAHNAALNYAALNRLLLGEIVLHRLRQATGEKIAAKLVCDAPHNSVTPYCGGWLHRKGAAPCLPGHPLVIPGSMGDATWLCLGLDASRMLDSASHGAGRAVSRTKIRHGTTAAVPTCVTLREERLVEEAPSAYKPVEQVIRVQENAGMLARIVKLTPILTFKA